MSQLHPFRDLAKFPASTIDGDETWCRIVTTDHAAAPWWFSNGGDGRFDLNPHSGRGTCYLAASVIGALVETVWRDAAPTGDPDVLPPVTRSELEGRRVAWLSPGPLQAANVTRDAGATLHTGFGITSALGTCDNYLRPQEWAGAFDAAAFDAIHYELAHGNGERALAVFGPGGVGTGTTTGVDTLLDVLPDGVEVLEDPDSLDLQVVDDPATARALLDEA